MLLPGQRKAIEEAVSRGESLPPDMASALLAAFQAEETAYTNVLAQYQKESVKTRDLLQQQTETQKLKGETLLLKAELEKTIDERVYMRTEALKHQLSEARSETSKWIHNHNVIDQELLRVQESFQRERMNYQGIIVRATRLLKQKMKPSLVSRFTWKRECLSLLDDSGYVKESDD